MYENPLRGWEIVTVVATGALGYFASDVIDRFVVSRKRIGPDGKTEMGQFWRSSPLSNDLLVRGGVGVAVAAVPLIAAQFIKHDMARSALQGFGVGAAVRLLGKAADDLATYLLKDGKAADDGTPALGRRLYGEELNGRKGVASALNAAGASPQIPDTYFGTAGLGSAPCATCGQTAGLGRCNCGRPSSMLPDCEVPSTPTGPQPVGQGKGNPMAPNCPPTGTTPGGGVDLTRSELPYSPPAITTRVPGTMVPGGGSSFTPTAELIARRFPAASVGVPGLPNGLGSLEHAREVLRTYEPAYRAVRSNAAALAAARNNTATPQQRATAERVTQSHAEGIRAMASFHPATLETAARGLGFLDDAPSSKWPGSSRHREHDDAAE